MPIQFVCPQCHRTLRVTRRKIGSQVTCPKCAASIEVPAGEPIVALADQPTRRSAEPEQPSALDWIACDDLPDLVPQAPSVPLASTRASGAPVLDAEPSGSVTAPSGSRVSIARASIYWQALLILLIALVALGLGYWWGGIDAQRPDATLRPPTGGQRYVARCRAASCGYGPCLKLRADLVPAFVDVRVVVDLAADVDRIAVVAEA